MPLPAIVAVTVAIIGSTIFLSNSVRTLRRRRRNMKHWENHEPLEGGRDDWD